MSKKHFIALADALRATRPSQQDIEMLTGEYTQWKRDVQTIANVCSNHNPQFSRQRFMDWVNAA
jgi:hypothetical protein